MTAPFSNSARIIDLHHQGLSHRQIAQQLGCHHRTVQRHLQAEGKRARESAVVRKYLDERRREREERPGGERVAHLDAPLVESKGSLQHWESFSLGQPSSGNPTRVFGYGLLDFKLEPPPYNPDKNLIGYMEEGQRGPESERRRGWFRRAP